MFQKSLNWKFLFLLIFLLIYWGCSPHIPLKKDIDPHSVNFWKPYLLYLQSTSCRSLYVEIDTVEGSEASKKCIESLRGFLQHYCDKPQSVEIILDETIPLQDVNAATPELLALQHMNGPIRAKDNGDAAYLYVLFYDSSMLADTKVKKPHVNLLPYPAAIYMDEGFFKSNLKPQILLHETGHVLGLTRNQAHGDDMHCQDKSCIMYYAYRVNLFRILLLQKQKQQDLCMLCQSDLETAKTSERDSKLRFIGPVLVRSENEYHVLSLPGFVRVHFGPLESINWRDVLKQAQSVAPEQAKLGNIAVDISAGDISDESELSKLKVAIKNAENDPYSSVRAGVNEAKEKLIGLILEDFHKE